VNGSDKNEAATVKYMTPEMILDKKSSASPPMDVWAIGIMLYSMLFNKFPFSGISKDEIKTKITTSTY
jgi:serine/threonine protein kinase